MSIFFGLTFTLILVFLCSLCFCLIEIILNTLWSTLWPPWFIVLSLRPIFLARFQVLPRLLRLLRGFSLLNSCSNFSSSQLSVENGVLPLMMAMITSQRVHSFVYTCLESLGCSLKLIELQWLEKWISLFLRVWLKIRLKKSEKKINFN